MSIYKKVNQLTNDDLKKYPVWRFLVEEEGKYDETHIKPMPKMTNVNSKEGIFILKTSFIANDSTSYNGYCYASEGYDLSYIQPVIIVNKKHISFWYGMYKPKELDHNKTYKILKKEKSNLFPIAFAADVKVDGNKYAGEIKGFMYLDDDDKIQFVG